MIVGKNSAQCHRNSGDLTTTNVFREVLLDLVGIHFHNCGTPIDPDHRRAAAGDALDVGNVTFERSPSATDSRGAAAGALVTILLT